jgi:hypothetical protein
MLAIVRGGQNKQAWNYPAEELIRNGLLQLKITPANKMWKNQFISNRCYYLKAVDLFCH